MKKQMNKIPQLKELVNKKAVNEKIGNYLWRSIVAPQLGYSFSCVHATAYSIIGYQSLYLATNWNPVYWNCACLTVNSGSLEDNST